jgi:threonine/homoserine/homoserine lactone efflux protein
MLAALLLGISYGFAAGISPGPLLGLVLSQTLQRGWRAGMIISFAPLFSDAPVILLAVLLLSRLPASAFGWLGIIGGLFVLYLGAETIYSTWRRRDAHNIQDTTQLARFEKGSVPAILGRAVLTNLLNPHPYLFWATVGAQLLLRIARQNGWGDALTFLLAFYALLVGSKLFIVLLAGRSRMWLQGRAYQIVLTASGILLCGLGILLISEGIHGLL